LTMSLDEVREILTEMAEGDDFIQVVPEFFCPEVVGHSDVKLGVMCCLVNQWDTPDGRDRINILLKGQPGCGKTIFIDHPSRSMGRTLSLGRREEIIPERRREEERRRDPSLCEV